MSFPRWPQILKVGLALLGLVILCVVALYADLSITRFRAKLTTIRMLAMSGWLMLDQPKATDTSSLRAVAMRHQADDYYKDAWGHPLVVEAWRDKSGRFNHYRIVALGRSGMQSSCCQRFIGHKWQLN